MSAVVAFPLKMKRGAKVKRGPLAKIRDFPGVLRGDALAKRWLWLRENYDKWDNEEFERDAEDTEYSSWRRTFGIAQGICAAYDDPLSDARMRTEIAKWTAVVKRRTAIKDWLESLGIDLGEACDAETALAFAQSRIGGTHHA